MICRVFVFASFLAIAFAIQCKSGNYMVLDGTPVDKSTVKTCASNVTMCLKEKIYLTGETGHNLQVIRFDCDTKNTCATFQQFNLTKDNTCSNLKDLWVGNVCCCQTDKCNVDMSMSAGRLGVLSVMISFSLSLLL